MEVRTRVKRESSGSLGFWVSGDGGAEVSVEDERFPRLRKGSMCCSFLCRRRVVGGEGGGLGGSCWWEK